MVALKIDKEKLTNESNQLLTNKKSVESDIINYNKKLKPTDLIKFDWDKKDNKKKAPTVLELKQILLKNKILHLG